MNSKAHQLIALGIFLNLTPLSSPAAYPVDSMGQLGAAHAQFNGGAVGSNKPPQFALEAQREVDARAACLNENEKLWGHLLDACIGAHLKLK